MITVYSKPNCVQCTATYRSLDAKGLEYQVVDVTTNDNALAYVKGELGYLGAPVVVVSEHDHWTGYRPDHIDRVAKGGATENEGVTP
ncbi:glutaredoxin-like protein NrdH [Frigoribacterium sp. CFBP 13707]|uniref:glutaredoxin-like protein NrdH n=1 Tax=Frigoribacterium sp. CFBP 13707 TaxID=2775313 RepID=UPI00177F4810|nr:glutaredoxin-like protein NrdH [Frigoribacterium sp. CFBP 13707]MBD8728977.1 glutaredoxin-like protein NrdH [Frigoribacterium sp. CFBP 13707]